MTAADDDTALNAAINLMGQTRGRAMLGCDWGRRVRTPDDPDLCLRQARQMIVLHDGAMTFEVKVCDAHRDRISAETDPHIGDHDGE